MHKSEGECRLEALGLAVSAHAEVNGCTIDKIGVTVSQGAAVEPIEITIPSYAVELVLGSAREVKLGSVFLVRTSDRTVVLERGPNTSKAILLPPALLEDAVSWALASAYLTAGVTNVGPLAVWRDGDSVYFDTGLHTSDRVEAREVWALATTKGDPIRLSRSAHSEGRGQFTLQGEAGMIEVDETLSHRVNVPKAQLVAALLVRLSEKLRS